jgi:hypothetical protein
VFMSSAGACFGNSAGNIDPCSVQHQTP